jgi:branched-chain amino acid transport system substrate-binding protein
VVLAYPAVQFAADAMERAGSADRAAITEAMASSTWAGHFMPYGPTEMINGQNQGARPLITQVQGTAIEVVAPVDYTTAPAIFPRPA